MDELVRNFMLGAALAVAFIVVAGCARHESDAVSVYVSIPPQKFFAERIGANRVEVAVMVEPGRNPATFDPLPQQVLGLARADVYFSIGVPFENTWMEKFRAANPDLNIVDTRRGITLRSMERFGRMAVCPQPEGTHRDHGGVFSDEYSHHGSGMDPHVWLSPRLAAIQAQNMCEALCSIDSEYEEFYRANLATLIGELEVLSADIGRTFSLSGTKTMLVFHPAWGYFADEFGLRQVAVEIEGKEPSPEQIAAVIDYARAENIRVVFVQPQFSARSAEAVARDIGGVVVAIDPLAEAYMDNLRSAAETIARRLK